MNNIKIKNIFNSSLLFLIAFSLPFYNLSINGRSPIYFIFFITLALFLIGYVNFRKKYPLEIIILFLLCLYKLFSILWSIDPIQTKEVVIYTIIPLMVITFFFYKILKEINDLNFLLKVYIFACFIFSVFVFFNFIFRPQYLILNLANSQITFLKTNPTEVSYFMLYGIIFLFYLESFRKVNKIIFSF